MNTENRVSIVFGTPYINGLGELVYINQRIMDYEQLFSLGYRFRDMQDNCYTENGKYDLSTTSPRDLVREATPETDQELLTSFNQIRLNLISETPYNGKEGILDLDISLFPTVETLEIRIPKEHKGLSVSVIYAGQATASFSIHRRPFGVSSDILFGPDEDELSS